MNINRHNYESFFLLYVDNELSAADRDAVDLFVSENPDLRHELVLLQHSTLDPETMTFSAKNELFRKADITELQENLNLYLDNEMPEADRPAFEKLVSSDNEAYRELNLLRLTRLEKEDIRLADKQSLYRTEGTRVIRMRWWRVAAAAVLLGFGLWTGVTVYRNSFNAKKDEPAVAANKNVQPENPSENGTPGTNNKPVAPGNELTANNNVPVNQAPANNETSANNPNPNNQSLQRPGQNIVSNNNPVPVKNESPVQKTPMSLMNNGNDKFVNNPVLTNTNKPSNNLPKSYLEKNYNGVSNESVVQNVPQTNPNNGISNSGINNALVQTNPKEKTNNAGVADINSNPADSRNTAAVQTVYKPTAPGNNNLLDDEDNSKRSKVGGFLRKVKRMIERNTNIKTGNEVKLAGFEIAIK